MLFSVNDQCERTAVPFPFKLCNSGVLRRSRRLTELLHHSLYLRVVQINLREHAFCTYSDTFCPQNLRQILADARHGYNELQNADRHARQISHHFSLAPSGTSSKKLANTGFPPSREAASSIPFDSSPRILRGARLVTTTILRPTSVSGA